MKTVSKTTSKTTICPIDIHTSYSWAKISEAYINNVKTYGAISRHFSQLGKDLANLSLADLQLVIKSMQDDLPALAAMADTIVKAPQSEAQILRQFQRDTHRNISTYLVPAYNEAQITLHQDSAKLAHYYRASGKEGVSSAIHALPQQAKTGKQKTATAKSGQAAPMVQPPLPVTQQADTLQHVITALHDNGTLSASALSASDLLAALANGLDNGLVTLSQLQTVISEHTDKLDKKQADIAAQAIAKLSRIVEADKKASKPAQLVNPAMADAFKKAGAVH